MIKKLINSNIIFIIVSLIIYTFYLYRNNDLYLLNPPDEYSFKILIQNTSLAKFDFASPLYVLFYKLIFLFEENFYNVAKIINLFFFLIGNIFIFLITTKLSTTNDAKLLFILCSLGAFNFFTSALMPESLFYMYFYLFIFFYLFIKNFYFKFIICAVNIFILFLIKGIGIFILPAILCNELFKYFTKRETLKKALFSTLIVSLLFLILFMLTNLFIDDNRNSVFGAKYNGIFKNIDNISELLFIIKLFITNYIGHLLYNFLIFGLLIIFLLKKFFLEKKSTDQIIIIPLLITIFLSLFSSLNHAMHVFTNPEINFYRITTRYYDFILPLFLISSLLLRKHNFNLKIKSSYITIVFVLVIFFIIFFTQVGSFRPTSVIFDSILFRGYIYNIVFFNIFLIFYLIIFIISFYIPHKIKFLYLVIYYPTILLFSLSPIIKEINTYKKPNDFDLLAEQFKKDNKLLHSSPTIITDNLIGEDFRVLFYLKTPIIELVTKASIDNKILNNKNTLVISNNLKFNKQKYRYFLNGRYVLSN